MYKYSIGEHAIIIDEITGFRGCDSDGIISRRTNAFGDNYYLVNFLSGKPIFFKENEINFVDPEFLKEKEKRKEQLRLKYIHIDPYGEENWEE